LLNGRYRRIGGFVHKRGRFTVKKALIVAGAVMLMGTGVLAQSTSVVNSKHNMNNLGGAPASYGGQVCVYCHTPHKANMSVGALWNKTAVSTPIRDGAPLAYFNQEASGTCLACHDGTIGVDSVINLGGVPAQWPTGGATGFTSDWRMAPTNPAYVGNDLSDDHPIGEDYQAIAPSTSTRWKVATPSTSGTVATLPVPGSTSTLRLPVHVGVPGSYTVECATCHTPHNPSNGYFLRAPNTGSAVCLACHIR
jgi:predicted CXXCH cytochrome family protein